jgi:hypothetical protein
VTIKFPNWGPLRHNVYIAYTKNRIPEKHLFTYRLQFSRHSLLDRWTDSNLTPFIVIFNLGNSQPALNRGSRDDEITRRSLFSPKYRETTPEECTGALSCRKTKTHFPETRLIYFILALYWFLSILLTSEQSKFDMRPNTFECLPSILLFWKLKDVLYVHRPVTTLALLSTFMPFKQTCSR